ncbi:hypothetical protein D3C71_2038430 [compost metagenome]
MVHPGDNQCGVQAAIDQASEQCKVIEDINETVRNRITDGKRKRSDNGKRQKPCD